MAKKIWHVEVEGRQHVIEMQIDTFLGIMSTGGGHIAVDGKVINTWGSSMTAAIPAKYSFEVEGVKAEFRRKGIMLQNPILYFDGKEIKEEANQMSNKEIHIGNGDRIKIERPFSWGLVIIVLAAFLVVGGIAYFVVSRSFPASSGPSSVAVKATPRTVLVPQTRNLVNGTITVGSGKHYDISFSVDTSIMKDVKVVGSFRASGGSGNDIVALVMNDTAYVNWANGHQVNVTYTSGKMTTDNINEAITVSGKYHLVFNNSFSSVSSKNVSTAIDLKWSELRNQ